jgi:hypothetical protein
MGRGRVVRGMTDWVRMRGGWDIGIRSLGTLCEMGKNVIRGTCALKLIENVRK